MQTTCMAFLRLLKEIGCIYPTKVCRISNQSHTLYTDVYGKNGFCESTCKNQWQMQTHRKGVGEGSGEGSGEGE